MLFRFQCLVEDDKNTMLQHGEERRQGCTHTYSITTISIVNNIKGQFFVYLFRAHFKKYLFLGLNIHF